ncbi:DUF6262 family protein [Gordonia alkanivorans]|uniref:DUF6262 family protein n=1 Tax=Gordonia alkanivorans TaxID=84096 RepID=UPI001F4DD145|nr:DUF6262 family protein [Gordonia alkanivorans]
MTAGDRAARTARLTAAARVRSADAEARARRAITRLHNSGQPITFTAIAQAAGVSTSFLYQHRELRTDIIGRRNSHAPNTKGRAQSVSPATLDSLRAKLTAATARNRQLAEHIGQLTAENQALRSRLLRSATSWPQDQRPAEPP